MKILVVGGSGQMGRAVAWDVAQHPGVTKVGLVGRRAEALKETERFIGGSKVSLHPCDISDRKAMGDVIKGYDVTLLTLPDRFTSYTVVDTSISVGVHCVDMLEEYHRRPDAYELEGLKLPAGMELNQYGDYLHETAIKNDVLFLDGIGFAPGLSNITVGEAIRKLDKAEVAVARVGGIPRKDVGAKNPLRYMITWAFWHVLREYMVKLYILKDGKAVEVDSATDLEPFHFSAFGKDEMLECCITPGMPSFVYTRPDLKFFAEKTVRWPGHWQGVHTLKECGLLNLEPVEVGGVKVVPRDVLLALIEPRLRARPGDTDVCVMWNTVEGIKNGKKVRYSYSMWDEADTKMGFSGMARVTGFPAAISGVMIAQGKIKERGIVPPEDCIYGPLYTEFIKELEKRKIFIEEKFEELK
jgi:lysine 6-dehydrogenase